MFYYIEGKLAHLDYGFAVLDANGVGYKLTITQTTYEAMPPHLSISEAPIVRLYTYMAVREDGIELFGFGTNEERACFNQLITVSGVGPKAAMSILSIMTPDALALAISTEDVKAISKASGVGAKTAARIVLELRDKVSKDMMGSGIPAIQKNLKSVITGPLSEASEALSVLGYDKNSILNALKSIDPKITDVSEIVRIALKKLSR
jgi:Holliday junction DNA helicase RuvA